MTKMTASHRMKNGGHKYSVYYRLQGIIARQHKLLAFLLGGNVIEANKLAG